MIALWLTTAVIVVIGIGATTNLILKSFQKKNNCQNSIEIKPCNKSDKEIAKEIEHEDKEIDKRFNDKNEKLKHFKINMHSQDTKKTNTLEDENGLVK